MQGLGEQISPELRGALPPLPGVDDRRGWLTFAVILNACGWLWPLPHNRNLADLVSSRMRTGPIQNCLQFLSLDPEQTSRCIVSSLELEMTPIPET